MVDNHQKAKQNKTKTPSRNRDVLGKFRLYYHSNEIGEVGYSRVFRRNNTNSIHRCHRDAGFGVFCNQFHRDARFGVFCNQFQSFSDLVFSCFFSYLKYE